MNHQDILEHEVIERYLKSRLGPEEEARFEEHYLSCGECLDRLALEESLGRGFKRAAGQEVARHAVARQLLVVAWLSRLSRSRQIAALTMTLLAVVLVPSLLTLRQSGKLREQRQQHVESEQRLAAQAEALREELAASQQETAGERQARATLEEQLRSAREPQGNVPILFLDAVRGEEGTPALVRLPATPGWIVLAPQMERPYRGEYRAVLAASDRREVWQGSGLRVNEMGTLSLSLPSALLSPGDYQLKVEGRRFAFRVVPASPRG